jgi:uncharacterized protein YndB with AHSA1/START domain
MPDKLLKMSFIKVQATINAPITKVWEYWVKEEHVMNWNFAVSDWHCPSAKNNLEVGAEFHYTMSAKDNSFSFDFWGTYQKIEFEKIIEIVLGDGRKMNVSFESVGDTTNVIEEFEPEQQNPEQRQQAGWQMILDNFKKYVEQ